jgi:hypothetical protein
MFSADAPAGLPTEGANALQGFDCRGLGQASVDQPRERGAAMTCAASRSQQASSMTAQDPTADAREDRLAVASTRITLLSTAPSGLTAAAH